MSTTYKVQVRLLKDDVEQSVTNVIEKTLDESKIIYTQVFEYLYGVGVSWVDRMLDSTTHFSALSKLLDLLKFV